MKININYKLVFNYVLFYPIFLSGFVLFGIEPFFMTVPYFTLLLCLLFLIKVPTFHLKNNISLVILILVSILNFNGVEYMMPIYFTLYIVFLTYSLKVRFSVNESEYFVKTMNKYFTIYLILGFAFIFNHHSYMLVNNRYLGFVGSATVFSSLLSVCYIVYHLSSKDVFFKKAIFYLATLFLIYLTETRLTLFFIIVFPVVIKLVEKKIIGSKFIFWGTYSFLLFLYPLYQLIVIYFPFIITMRYSDNRDASFGLRYLLYETVQKSYYENGLFYKIFGKGNEFARNLIITKFGYDHFPHNDLIRLLLDWGLLGLIFFTLWMFKLSKKNQYALYCIIIYMIMFYSNMIYNLFLVSIVILFSKVTLDSNLVLKKIKSKN